MDFTLTAMPISLAHGDIHASIDHALPSDPVRA
jgi:hypothetical protein